MSREIYVTATLVVQKRCKTKCTQNFMSTTPGEEGLTMQLPEEKQASTAEWRLCVLQKVHCQKKKVRSLPTAELEQADLQETVARWSPEYPSGRVMDGCASIWR